MTNNFKQKKCGVVGYLYSKDKQEMTNNFKQKRCGTVG